MRQLKKILKDIKYIIFFDLESTQIHHYVISIGASKVEIDEKGKIKKEIKNFYTLVKPLERVGRVVKDLTKLDEKTLYKKGIDFPKAIDKFYELFKTSIHRTIFFTYGNSDKHMLINTCQDDVTREKVLKIIKRTYDFSSIISTYIKDTNGNILSLQKLVKLFNLETSIDAHNALSDALDLKNIYRAFIENKELLYENYRKIIMSYGNLPYPLQQVLNKLKKNESITPEMLDAFIRKEIDD